MLPRGIDSLIYMRGFQEAVFVDRVGEYRFTVLSRSFHDDIGTCEMAAIKIEG